MLWWRLSFLVWQMNVCLSAKKGTFPSKISQFGSVENFGIDLNDPDDDYNTFSPFFPGIDAEMNLFGHPSFSVARAHPGSRQCQNSRFTPCNIIFENHLPPTGRQFDRRQGAFICNVPGLYYFSFAALSQSFSSARVSLTKNDHEVVSAYAAAIGNHMASNSILLLLRPDDKVCVKLFEGHLYESENPLRAYTTFSGFLIQSAVPGFGAGNFRPGGQGLPPPPGRPFPSFGNGVNGPGILGPGQTLEAGPRKEISEVNNTTTTNITAIN